MNLDEGALIWATVRVRRLFRRQTIRRSRPAAAPMAWKPLPPMRKKPLR